MQQVDIFCKMRVVVSLIIFLLFSVLSFSKKRMPIFYVSSSCGDNSYVGSKDRPKKNIWSITDSIKNDVVIRLKRGDVFYENIHHLSNIIIEAYGKGEKPILCGFRVLKDSNAWELGKDSIWSLVLNNDDNFEGFPKSLATNKDCFNNFGCIYNPYDDKIYGHMVRKKGELLQDGDFIVSEVNNINEINKDTFGRIYFKSKISPRAQKRLCFSVFEHGISNIKKGKIKDIVVIGFAKHGMCKLMDCEINNCELDIIGGAIQVGSGSYIRFGNGIEFWVSDPPQSGNTIVKKCTISRTYDCGATIQGRNGMISDVLFRNNKFIYCRQAFEHFINDRNPTSNYVRCGFVGNIVYDMGNNQFSSPEDRDGNLLSYESPNKNLTISNNLFYGASHYDGLFFANIMNGNVIYLHPDQYLTWCHYAPKLDKVKATELDKYRKRSRDNSKVFVVSRGTSNDLNLRKKLLRKIKYSKHNLKIK